MEFLNVLTREEMKNVKGGCSIETNYAGCNTASRVFSCWGRLCMEAAVVLVWQAQFECVETVEESKLAVQLSCGPLYS